MDPAWLNPPTDRPRGTAGPCESPASATPTFEMSAPQSVLVLVESSHDDLPVGVYLVKVSRLPRQLLPDILSQEDVLQFPVT